LGLKVSISVAPELPWDVTFRGASRAGKQFGRGGSRAGPRRVTPAPEDSPGPGGASGEAAYGQLFFSILA
jgi:hypothetical protein